MRTDGRHTSRVQWRGQSMTRGACMQDLTRVGLASCGFLAVVALGACSDQPPTAPIDVAAAGSTSAAQLASRGDSLAYALGTALGDGALPLPLIPQRVHRTVSPSWGSAILERVVQPP